MDIRFLGGLNDICEAITTSPCSLDALIYDVCKMSGGGLFEALMIITVSKINDKPIGNLVVYGTCHLIQYLYTFYLLLMIYQLISTGESLLFD